MKALTALVAFAALAATSVRAKSASDVITLTKDTFQDFVDKDLSLVEFFAPWCGHCQRLEPEYEQAAAALKKLDEPISIAKVDCTEQTEVCEKEQIRGYPTLKVFRNGTPSEYRGARTADSIVSYMKKQSLPPVSELTADKVASFSKTEKVVIIGFFSSKDSPEYKAFAATANNLRDDFVFGATFDTAAASKNGVKTPGIVLFKQFDEGKSVYDATAFSEDDIASFVKTKSVPLIGDIGPTNYGTYVEAGLPMAYLFWSKEEDKKKYGAMLEPIAKKFQGKISFVYIDANQFGGHAKNLNLKEQWPAFGIHTPSSNAKYPLDQEKELTAAEMEKLVKGVADGSIKPSLKSEPEPEDNNGPVKTVVGSSYEKIVNDPEKDVLLELYATWCGHCKRLAPIWEDLGKKLSSNRDIVIAKMEATENDLPPSVTYRVEGFPTIKLIKAKTNEVVDYDGERTVEGFISFLQKNAVNKVEVSEDAAADDETAVDEDAKRDEL